MPTVIQMCCFWNTVIQMCSFWNTVIQMCSFWNTVNHMCSFWNTLGGGCLASGQVFYFFYFLSNVCVIVCVTVCVLVCVYVPYVLFWRQNKQVWEQMCIIVCVPCGGWRPEGRGCAEGEPATRHIFHASINWSPVSTLIAISEKHGSDCTSLLLVEGLGVREGLLYQREEQQSC